MAEDNIKIEQIRSALDRLEDDIFLSKIKIDKFTIKKTIFLTILILINFLYIYGRPLDREFWNNFIINESEIPMPEIQYELPEVLIGEFFLISSFLNNEITIFQNNKYIFISSINQRLTDYCFGHIVKNDDKWYFFPLSRPPRNRPEGYIRNITEIFLTDSGFSFYSHDIGHLISMRNEHMPVADNIASEISVSYRMSVRKYFNFYTSKYINIDYNDIHVSKHCKSIYHALEIDSGIVRISMNYCNNFAYIAYEGFLEIIEENSNQIKGIIKFTNGISYFYIPDGTAEIEINNDGSIIISMLYIPDLRYVSELAKEFQFPARLVMEF